MTTFEQKMTRLEEIVEQMETAKVPLNELIDLFKEGTKLSKECKKELVQLEQTVQKVIAEEADGMLVTEPMEI
jgi:exodeoxyribonuclease VII small subunit